MTSRKKPSVAFWATVVVVVVLIGYPLTFGPWCWIVSRAAIIQCSVPSFYRPITRVAEASPAARMVIEWYARSLAARGWGLYDDDHKWWMIEYIGMI